MEVWHENDNEPPRVEFWRFVLVAVLLIALAFLIAAGGASLIRG